MIEKNIKNLAISLREEGLSYSDILKKIPVAKSTLSLWLRSVGLSKKQKQLLTERKMSAIRKGGLRRHEQRLNEIDIINKNAIIDVGLITKRDLWLTGTMLYWAEGSKQKDWDVSVGIQFSNSDSRMIRVFILFLQKCLSVAYSDMKFELYIHESCRFLEENIILYWSNELSFPISKLEKVYYKKNIINSKRKNRDVNYHGQLSIKVKRSTRLNRKISGWINGFCQNIAGSSNGRTLLFGSRYSRFDS
jgi:hypothetical protein